MPAMDDKLQQDLDNGKVVLGGCCLTENDPQWQCVDCELMLFKKERVLLEYIRRPRKCPLCQSTEITTHLTEQPNLTPNIIEAIKEKLFSSRNETRIDLTFELERRLESIYYSLDAIERFESTLPLSRDVAEKRGWNCEECTLPMYKVVESA